MPVARKVLIMHADGEMIATECPILEEGPDTTTLIDVEGIAYYLYRYTATTPAGIEHGYVAAPTPPTVEEQSRVSCLLFGPGEPGIRSLEAVQRAPSETPTKPAPQIREMAPSGIVIRFAFRDGPAEDLFGERTVEPSVVAAYRDAICAYRFLRPSTNQFTPWVPVTMRDLANLRAALTYRLGIVTDGRPVIPKIEIATAASA
jgi:hypothetical protein